MYRLVYDLIVIGGGPAGYHAAAKAGKAGLSVLMVEKNKVGGICLNEGCIPSKAFLHSAKIYSSINNALKYGIKIEADASYLQANVVERKDKIVKKLFNAIEYLLKSSNVEQLFGEATIRGRVNNFFEIDVDQKTYMGSKLLIATGSEMDIPYINGLEESFKSGYAMTSKEVFHLDTVPSSLLIIGGGAVGLEMACYFNAIGSKVTVIDCQDSIASFFDKDMAEVLHKIYKKKGVDIYLNSGVKEIRESSVLIESRGDEVVLTPENVLVCTGRKPKIKGLGLESLGIRIENGNVCVDSKCRTNVENVYAAGDVNGKYMLAHVAYREADVCINNMIGKNDTISYNSIPNIIFGNPEAALAGETENTAVQKGIEYKKVLLPMQYSGRFVVENEPGNEMCKILVDTKTKSLIGIQMIGSYVSEIIYGVAALIEKGCTVDEIERFIFPHPTVSEIIKQGLQEFDW